MEHHFLQRIRDVRKDKFCAIWVYQSREALDRFWGAVDQTRKKKDYPENWKEWEDEVLVPFLRTDPDKIDFTSYEEF